MEGYARLVFSVAAVFNFAVAGAALAAGATLLATLGLEPATGTNVVFVDITALMIGVFGFSYACVAYDPHAYRPYISLGVIGKLLVVAAAA
jgi:hypothetical protein